MDKFRMRFSKTGRAVYISHLDLMHTFQRGFSRAGYELKYSEGFNPHPVIAIAMPLSVGTASVCELMDFRLKEDRAYTTAELQNMAGRLTAALPEGITVERIYEPVQKIADLKWLLVQGSFCYDTQPDAAQLREFFARKEILVTKKTKHGTAEINLVDGIDSLQIDESDGTKLQINALVSAQNPTLNPELLVEALQKYCPELVPDFHSFRRMAVYGADRKEFF